jgi:hypothetical protein
MGVDLQVKIVLIRRAGQVSSRFLLSTGGPIHYGCCLFQPGFFPTANNRYNNSPSSKWDPIIHGSQRSHEEKSRQFCNMMMMPHRLLVFEYSYQL